MIFFETDEVHKTSDDVFFEAEGVHLIDTDMKQQPSEGERDTEILNTSTRSPNDHRTTNQD